MSDETLSPSRCLTIGIDNSTAISIQAGGELIYLTVSKNTNGGGKRLHFYAPEHVQIQRCVPDFPGRRDGVKRR